MPKLNWYPRDSERQFLQLFLQPMPPAFFDDRDPPPEFLDDAKEDSEERVVIIQM